MARLQAQYHLFISCGQCRGVIWADVVVSRCVVCTDHGRPRALEAAGFEQGAEGDCPPTMRQRMPERFMRCVTRVAASTIPEPVASARGSACGGDACGRRTVPCRCRPCPRCVLALRVVHAEEIPPDLLDEMTGGPVAGSAFERHIVRYIAERMNLTPPLLEASLRRTKPDRWEVLMGTVAQAWIERNCSPPGSGLMSG